MKTNKNAQNNKVQKSEKETAVKVTALAIIPKPMTLICGQDMPTTAGVTEAPETETVPTVVEEAPQQATLKAPLATATAETDLDITTVFPSADNHRKTFNDISLQELADSIREVGVLQAIAVRPRTAGDYSETLPVSGNSPEQQVMAYLYTTDTPDASHCLSKYRVPSPDNIPASGLHHRKKDLSV